MKSRDFCYWLQGFFELNGQQMMGQVISNDQANVIQQHLALVFKHEIDPAMGGVEHQQSLNAIHNNPVFDPNVKMRC